MIKTLLIVSIILLVIFSPIILLSNWTLEQVQKIVNNYPEKPWSASWQIFLGDIYRYTFRQDRALECYKIFLDRYPQDPRYPEIKYYYAQLLAVEGKITEAKKEITEFLEWYPDHPLRPSAEKILINLKHGVFR